MSELITNISNQERSLAIWNTVVFTMITVALLFYHMTTKDSLMIRSSHAAIVTVILIICSTIISTYALVNFYSRTKILENSKDISGEKVKIRQSRIIYTVITSFIIFAQVIITLSIVSKKEIWLDMFRSL